MKINKTEREFRDTLRPAISQFGSTPLEQRLDAVISALDLEFEEEPSVMPLPDRLLVQIVAGRPMFGFHYDGVSYCSLSNENEQKVYLEAAACYNVVKNLHRHSNSPGVTAAIRSLVETERRKL